MLKLKGFQKINLIFGPLNFYNPKNYSQQKDVLKGNQKVRSRMWFFIESVDLYLVSTFAFDDHGKNGQTEQGTCRGP